MAADALIFDLDGTVWDSAGWFAAALAADDPEEIATMRQRLVAGGNIVGALKQAGMTRQKLLREAQRRGGAPPLFAGMAEVLRKLFARGTPLAVATNLPGTIAMPMLQASGLADTFQAIVHAGLCRTLKPHPASIQMVLRMLGKEGSPAIYYVGDRASDMEAATRAGVSGAWVAHGYEQPAVRSGFKTIVAADLLSL